jgi:hypothetical protein
MACQLTVGTRCNISLKNPLRHLAVNNRKIDAGNYEHLNDLRVLELVGIKIVDNSLRDIIKNFSNLQYLLLHTDESLALKDFPKQLQALDFDGKGGPELDFQGPPVRLDNLTRLRLSDGLSLERFGNLSPVFPNLEIAMLRMERTEVIRNVLRIPTMEFVLVTREIYDPTNHKEEVIL